MIMITSCAHYDLMCAPCAGPEIARLSAIRPPYGRCRECDRTTIFDLITDAISIRALPGWQPQPGPP
jgi:hypothetical protein